MMQLKVANNHYYITKEEFENLVDTLYNKDEVKGWGSKDDLLEWFIKSNCIVFTKEDDKTGKIVTKWYKKIERKRKLKNVKK